MYKVTYKVSLYFIQISNWIFGTQKDNKFMKFIE